MSTEIRRLHVLMAEAIRCIHDGNYEAARRKVDYADVLLRDVEALLTSTAEPSPTEEQFVVLAADDYARRCVAATGQAFQISELVNLKAWFYAGARWRDAHPGADVIGPQSSTMAPAEPSPVDAQPEGDWPMWPTGEANPATPPASTREGEPIDPTYQEALHRPKGPV